MSCGSYWEINMIIFSHFFSYRMNRRTGWIQVVNNDSCNLKITWEHLTLFNPLFLHVDSHPLFNAYNQVHFIILNTYTGTFFYVHQGQFLTWKKIAMPNSMIFPFKETSCWGIMIVLTLLTSSIQVDFWKIH